MAAVPWVRLLFLLPLPAIQLVVCPLCFLLLSPNVQLMLYLLYFLLLPRILQSMLCFFCFLQLCKMVNLVNTLGWSGGMLSMNGRSHVIRHVLTLRIFGVPKKMCFRQNREEVLNWLNSASELSCTWATCRGQRWGYMQESRVRATWRGHVQGACELPKVICIYEWMEL